MTFRPMEAGTDWSLLFVGKQIVCFIPFSLWNLVLEVEGADSEGRMPFSWGIQGTEAKTWPGSFRLTCRLLPFNVFLLAAHPDAGPGKRPLQLPSLVITAGGACVTFQMTVKGHHF